MHGELCEGHMLLTCLGWFWQSQTPGTLGIQGLQNPTGLYHPFNYEI